MLNKSEALTELRIFMNKYPELKATTISRAIGVDCQTILNWRNGRNSIAQKRIEPLLSFMYEYQSGIYRIRAKGNKQVLIATRNGQSFEVKGKKKASKKRAVWKTTHAPVKSEPKKNDIKDVVMAILHSGLSNEKKEQLISLSLSA